MRRNLFLLFVISCSFFIVRLNAQNKERQTTDNEQNSTNNELLIELKPETNVTDFFTIFEKQFPNSIHSIVSESFNIYKIAYKTIISQYDSFNNPIELSSTLRIDSVKYFLNNSASILGFSTNSLVSPRGTTPNDSLYNQQYYLPKTSVPQLWDITQGGVTACGDTIVVAVIDEGFDLKIKDFAGNIFQNKSEIPNNGIDDDGNGYVDDYQGFNFYAGNDNHDKTQFDNSQNHGNECAGIIGARGNNISGIAGINWRTKMLVLTASRSEEYIIKAYDYVYKMRKLYNDSNGAKGAFIAVTSCSLGIDKARPEDHLPWCNVYDKLGQIGVLNFVATTNNTGDLNTIGDVPGLCTSDYLVVVNGTDENDKLYSLAPTSKTYIGLAAPANNILSTDPLNYIPPYDIHSGNSFAAPQVAGVAALLYSINDIRLCPKNFVSPSDAATKIKNAIYNGVDKIPALAFANKTGGRLNAFNAYKALQVLLPTNEIPITNYELRITPNPADLVVSCQLTVDSRGVFNTPTSTGVLNTPTTQDGRIQYAPTVNCQLFDNLGRVFYKLQRQGSAIASTFDIDCSTFPNGLYFLRCETENGIITKKVVVNH